MTGVAEAIPIQNATTGQCEHAVTLILFAQMHQNFVPQQSNKRKLCLQQFVERKRKGVCSLQSERNVHKIKIIRFVSVATGIELIPIQNIKLQCSM